MMDACSDPSIPEVVIMSGAQLGKSEAILNIIGYHMAHDPCPILMMQPTVEMAQSFSKDRITAGLVRSTPCLRGKLKEPRTKDSNNSVLHKVFPGGALSMVGANSPAGLASRPIRVVLCDEVDRYPPSAGSEGDPIMLAKKRTATFWNRKIIMVSTPTNKGGSRIEQAFEISDQRYYHVPCQHCGHEQVLKWSGVKWDMGDPMSAKYVCEECGSLWDDVDRAKAIRQGRWIASKPFNGVAGFAINGIYSPWTPLSDGVRDFLEARKQPATLRVWTNTYLGETWEEEGEAIDDFSLYERREEYGPELPEEVLTLTCGVDVQDDRLEAEVVGWGIDEESWSIEYRTFYGDPSAPQVWRDLDEFLKQTYEHPCGEILNIMATCIDSGGHYTQSVYKYVAKREGSRIFAIKGVGGDGRPIIGKPSRNNIGKIRLFPVGVDVAKHLLYSRLVINEPGPGYCHFPMSYQLEYFKQLTAEKIKTRYHKGFAKREFVKMRQRNEALDVRVYAMAAFNLMNVNLQSLARKFQSRMEAEPEVKKPVSPVRQKNMTSFVNRWVK
jgi:phage terminase large subunit GpA-like protein